MQRSHGESITRLQGGTDLDWDLSENREKHVREEEDHGDAKLALEDSTDPRETIWLGLWNRIAARSAAGRPPTRKESAGARPGRPSGAVAAHARDEFGLARERSRHAVHRRGVRAG